jgi:hypothetical protein
MAPNMVQCGTLECINTSDNTTWYTKYCTVWTQSKQSQPTSSQMVLNMRPFSKQMLPDVPHTHTNVATWGTIWEPSTALWTLQCQMEPNVVNLYPAINKSSPFGTPQLPNWPHRSTPIWWNLPFGATYNAKYIHKLINWVPLVPTNQPTNTPIIPQMAPNVVQCGTLECINTSDNFTHATLNIVPVGHKVNKVNPQAHKWC